MHVRRRTEYSSSLAMWALSTPLHTQSWGDAWVSSQGLDTCDTGLSIPWILYSASESNYGYFYTELREQTVQLHYTGLSVWAMPQDLVFLLFLFSPAPWSTPWGKNILSLSIHWFSLEFHTHHPRLLNITMTGGLRASLSLNCYDSRMFYFKRNFKKYSILIIHPRVGPSSTPFS